MASVIKDPGGRKRLQFVGADRRTRTLYLGKMEMRQADTVRIRVEALVAAGFAGTAPDAETARWVGDLPPRLRAKLAKVGLVAQRGANGATLKDLADEFFRLTSVKPGTRRTYEQTRRSLEDAFGPSRGLLTIKALDADRWRQGLKEEGLSAATVSKRVKTARQMFKQGVRWGMLGENPFADVKAGSQTNKSRMRFVTLEETDRLLDACPSAEWRVIVALSRYGGLRCPSEHMALRWTDIDWAAGRITVWSSKTEGIEGKEYRHVPLFPELREHLEGAFAGAAEGTEFVITTYRSTACNLRTQLLRIMARAGVGPWPKVLQNLRASRQTELCASYPLADVCAWLGNSVAVASRHYLMPRDQNFADAVRTTTAGKTTRKTTLQPAESGGQRVTMQAGPIAQVA